jgi:hypothetical protein
MLVQRPDGAALGSISTTTSILRSTAMVWPVCLEKLGVCLMTLAVKCGMIKHVTSSYVGTSGDTVSMQVKEVRDQQERK